MTIFYIDNISIEVLKKKIKNMTVRICAPLGQVKISAPLRTSNRSILQFATTHIEWIKKHQSVYQQSYTPAPVYDKSHRQTLATHIESFIPHWEDKMGVCVDKYQIRLMKSRWGSCTPHKRKICLNLALVNYPIKCLEYVLVHEMVHLLEPSHNARFKSLMNTFMPEWRQYKAILDQTL